MKTQYKVEYGIPSRNSIDWDEYETDDPVSCEDFLSESLEKGFSIYNIKRNGSSLSQKQFDRFVKGAAEMLAGQHICKSLHINSEEERFRFGFAT